MKQHFSAPALFSALALLLWAVLPGAAAVPPPSRISFQIATGSTAGTFFPVGEAIAGLISHPPGVNRCQNADVCGPAGLIVSTRTSEGAADNLIAVNRGDVESGLAQSDVIAAAVDSVPEGWFTAAPPALYREYLGARLAESPSFSEEAENAR